MWETFNSEPIRELISDDFIYQSHWVLRPIKCKTRFFEYIEKKLVTIKNAIETGEIEIQFSIGQIPGQDDEYFLLIYHTIRNNRFQSMIRVEVVNDLIIRMSIEPLKRRYNIHPIDLNSL